MTKTSQMNAFLLLGAFVLSLSAVSASSEPYLFYMNQKNVPDLIDLCKRIEFSKRDFRYFSSLLRFAHERAVFAIDQAQVDTHADLITYEPNYFQAEQVLDLVKSYIPRGKYFITKQFMRYYLNREFGKSTKDLIYLLIFY
jgi:hypothetical protein